MISASVVLLSLSLLGWVDPAADRMVVCSFRTGELELFAVDPTTGDARNLTRSPKSVEKYPSCSFAGDRVAFISNRDGTDTLYVMNADGSGVRRLTHEKPGIDAGMASWTADGDWLYFGLYGGGPPRMCRIRPDGSDFKVVGEGIDPAVSPDGKRVAFARALGDSHHLFVMDTDRTDARQLTAKGNGWGGVHATWTPDGNRIVYGDKAGEAIELFACEPDSGTIRQLTRLGGAATSPSVSPDGRWISFRLCDEVYWRSGETSRRAYEERRADKRPVWVMGADGSAPHVVEALHYQTTIDGSRAPFLKQREVVDHLAAGKFDVFDMNEVHLRDLRRSNLAYDDYLGQFLIGHYNPRGNHFFTYSIKPRVDGWLDPRPITYREPDPNSVDFRGYLPVGPDGAASGQGRPKDGKRP